MTQNDLEPDARESDGTSDADVVSDLNRGTGRRARRDSIRDCAVSIR